MFVFKRFMVLVGFATAFRANFAISLKNFTSKYVLLNLDSQTSLALISNLASPSSVVVDLRSKVEDVVRSRYHDRYRLTSSQRNREVHHVLCGCISISESRACPTVKFSLHAQ